MPKYFQKKIDGQIAKNLEKIDSGTSLYVNYPFCIHRCSYCIYHIDKYGDEKSDRFLKYYQKEVLMYAKKINNFKFKELHIGGGTPNLVDPKLLIGPLGELVDFEKINNFVLEVFPMPNLAGYLKKIERYNVTKINLGAQTLDDKILRSEHRYLAKNRYSRCSDIINCLEVLSKSKLSWSVDLVYGLIDREASRDYIGELKTVLRCRPSGFHLFNIRSQKQNKYYSRPKQSGLGSKYMETFDYGQISDILVKNNYRLIGDEWCLLSDRKNVLRAQRVDRYYGEAPTLGLGLGARSKNRQISYINFRDLDKYCEFIDNNYFPVEKIFDYQDKYYIVANILLAFNQSSRFDINSIPKDASQGELKEVSLLLAFLKNKGISLEIKNSKIIVSRGQWTRTIDLIEKYLKAKNGVEYFYKN